MIFRDYVRGDIGRNRKSYGSSILTIFLGVLILSSFVFGFYSYFESYKDILEGSTSGYHFRITSPISREDLRELRDNRYIDRLGLLDSYMSQEGLASKSKLEIISLDENTVSNLRDLMKDGDLPGPGEICLSSNCLKDLDKKLGDRVSIEGKSYRISASYYDSNYDYEDLYQVFIYKSQEELLETGRNLSSFIWYKNIFRTYDLSQKIMDRLDYEDLSYNYNSIYLDKSFVFHPDTRLMEDHPSAFIVILIFIILLCLFYSIISNLFYVQETKALRDYSLLKSIGASEKDLAKIVRLKTVYMSLPAIGLGNLLSLGLLRGLFFIIRKVSNSYEIAGGFLLANKIELKFSLGLELALIALSFILIYLASKRPIRKLRKVSILHGLRGRLDSKSHRKHDLNYRGNIEKDLARQFYKNSRRNFLFTDISLKLGFILMSFMMLGLSFYSMSEKYNHLDSYRSYNLQGDFASLKNVDQDFLREVRALGFEEVINFRSESVYMDYDRELVSDHYKDQANLEKLEEKLSPKDNLRIDLVGLEDEIFNKLVSERGLRPEDYRDGKVLLLNTMGDDLDRALSRIKDLKFLRDDLKEVKLSEYGDILDEKGYEFSLNIEDKIEEPLFDYPLKKNRLHAYMPKSEYIKLFNKFERIADLDQFEYLAISSGRPEKAKEDLEALSQNYFKEGNYFIRSEEDQEKSLRKNTMTWNILAIFLSFFFMIVGFSNSYFAFYNLFLKRREELELYRAIGMDRELLAAILKLEKKKIIFRFIWPMPLIVLFLALLMSKVMKMFGSLELIFNMNYSFILAYILIIYLAISSMYNHYIDKNF